MSSAEGDHISRASKTIFVIGGSTVVGLMSLMINLFIGVSKDAQIALEVAKQHGQEILEVRAELTLIRADLRESSRDRYYRRDAERDIARLELMIRDAHGKE